MKGNGGEGRGGVCGCEVDWRGGEGRGMEGRGGEGRGVKGNGGEGRGGRGVKGNGGKGKGGEGCEGEWRGGCEWKGKMGWGGCEAYHHCLTYPPPPCCQGYSVQPARGSSEIQVVNQAFDYISEFDDDTNPYAESPGGGAVPLDADAVLDAFVASQDKEILYASVPPEHVARKREEKERRSMAKVERKGWQAYQQRTRQPDGSGASDEELLLQDYNYGLPNLVEVDTRTSEGRRQQRRIDGAGAGMY